MNHEIEKLPPGEAKSSGSPLASYGVWLQLL